MRLLTVNLWNGRADPAHLARHLDEADPDVVVAQELAPAQARVLAQRFRFGAIEARRDTHGRALVAKEPIRVQPLTIPHRSSFRGLVEVDGREVEIVTLHLSNPIQGIDSVWGMGERRRQLDVVEPIVSGPGRKLVVGDLNATPLWPAYRRLRRHLLDGVAEWAREQGRRPPRTWSPRPWLPAMLRIDHVLVRGLRVTDVRVDRIPGGDHRAVTVDLVTIGP